MHMRTWIQEIMSADQTSYKIETLPPPSLSSLLTQNILLSPPSSISRPKMSEEKKSLKDKLVQNAGGITAALNAANSLATGLMGERDEFSGKEGNLARTLDSGYDKIGEAAGLFGQVGKLVQMGMVANKLVGNIVGKLGGGTDGMTKIDSILGSPFLLMTPFGLINGFGGKKADSFSKDNELFAAMGSSYGGASDMADDALAVQGKKYGAFSSGAMQEANEAISEAKRQQMLISRVNTEAQNRRALSESMAGMNANAYALSLQGGYDLSAVRVGKQGMMLRAKQIISAKKYQRGNKVNKTEKPSFEDWYNSIPENYKGELYDYKMAYKVLPTEMLLKHAYDPENNHLKSVSGIADENGRIPFLKLGTVELNPEIQSEFDVYNSDDDLGKMLRSKYNIIYSGDRYYYIPKVNSIIQPSYIKSVTPVYKEGGNISKDVVVKASIIKSVTPVYKVLEFKEGGSFNVIPEGALHARKHNMENADNLTKKGIPVVTEDENGELLQQAEIEKEEIILRLSVTKRLEELSKENTDETAIEAGKLLVQEILYNTIDHTNNLL